MSKFSMYMSNLQNVRMDYSYHGRHKSNHIGSTLFSLLISQNNPRTACKIINFLAHSLVSVNSIKKGNQHTGTSPGIL